MKFNELKAELDAGNSRNLYIFTGPEKEVLNKYVKRISDNVITAKTFESIIPRLTTKNLFNPKQTFLIDDDKGASEMEYAQLQSLIGANTVILVYKDIDKRKKLFKSAAKNIVEFERFTENQLVWYVQKELEVTDEIAAMISRYSGNDVARIENECQKLQLLEKEITPDLVRELIHPPVEDRIFDMMDFIAKKNPYATFKLYYDLIELKTSPIQMIGLLYMKFKQIFLVQTYSQSKNNDIATKTGLNPYQIGLTRPLVGVFSPEQLVWYMRKIQKIEVDIKTGRVDMNTGMEALLVDILK